MEWTIKSVIAELPNYIVARIIHKELLVFTMDAFSRLQLIYLTLVSLGGSSVSLTQSP